MGNVGKCVSCGDKTTYFNGILNACAICGHEWTPSDGAPKEAKAEPLLVVDSNGTELLEGDDVTVIKDLKVKGSSMVIKRGTKVRGIRLTEIPDEVDCRIDGTSMVLVTRFLKKG